MMLLIAADAPLGAEWLDHPLAGDYEGFRECRIGGDFLLIYKIDRSQIVFTRVGTHAELLVIRTVSRAHCFQPTRAAPSA